MNQTQQQDGRTGGTYLEEAGHSYRPILVAFAVLLLAVGMLSNLVVSALGLVLLLINIAGWVQENRDEAFEKEADRGQDA